MSAQLVALTREDCRLSAIVSRVVVGEPEHGGERPRAYSLTAVPVDRVKTADVRERRAVEAWRRGDAVRLDDAESVASAIGVLLATVPMGAPAGGVPTSDGRAWLCQPLAWAGLRAELRARPAPVLRRLREMGWGAAVERLADARDPYLAYHHGAGAEPALQSLPPRFRACVLPPLRGRAWSDVRRALSLYWTLDLGRQDPRLAAVVRLLATPHGLGWVERIARAAADCHDALLGQVLADAQPPDPTGLPRAFFDGFGLVDPEGDADRLGHLLRLQRLGVPAGETLEEIQFAAAFAPEYRFGRRWLSSVRRHRRLPAGHAAGLARLLGHLQGAGALEGHRSFAPRLWRWSSAFPENAAVLARPALFEWPAGTARDVLDALMLRSSPERTVGAQMRAFEQMLSLVPVSHHPRAVEEGAEVLEHVPARATARAMRLVARLARPPYLSRAGLSGAAALLARVAGERWDAIARIPERALQRLDRALVDDHGVLPLHAGLRAMAERTPELFWQALVAHPGPLLTTARGLGFLADPRRRDVLKRFRAHPVADRWFGRTPVEAICSAVEQAVRGGVPSPVPRRLREHREGRTVLSPGSLERHRQAIVRRLPAFRLRLLALMALEDVRRDLPSDLGDDAERHALQMLATVTINRRLLRRVLRVPPASRARFLAEHPANRAWLSRHACARQAAWSAGLVEDARAEGGWLRLAFERDPLELLRIGTRVGSCLSAGGIHDDAAVAAMADPNKRVVVARDERGAFVARQRVGLADDDRLVCAAVYPLGVAEEVKRAFLEYDRRLAAALAVPLALYGESSDVAEVLSRTDYDDGIWDRLTENG